MSVKCKEYCKCYFTDHLKHINNLHKKHLQKTLNKSSLTISLLTVEFSNSYVFFYEVSHLFCKDFLD